MEVSVIIHSSAVKGSAIFCQYTGPRMMGLRFLRRCLWVQKTFPDREREHEHIHCAEYTVLVYNSLFFLVKAFLKSDSFIFSFLFFFPEGIKLWLKSHILSEFSFSPSHQKKHQKTSYNPLKRFQNSCTKPYQLEALPELKHFLKRVSRLQTLRIVWWICLDRLEFWIFSTSLHTKVHPILSEFFRLEMGFLVAVLLIRQRRLKYQVTVKYVPFYICPPLLIFFAWEQQDP